MPPTLVEPERPPTTASPDRAERRAVPPRSRGPRWLFGAALGLSAVIHLLLLLLLRFSLVNPGEAWLLAPAPNAVPAPAGMQVVNIEPVAVAPEAPPTRVENLPEPRPAPTRTPTVPVPAPITVTPPVSGAGAVETPPRSAIDRILPRNTDPRLWTPILPPAARVLDADEAVQARVADRLAAWNDSMAAEAEAAGRALDWTTTDANGNKWGISPGKIHLGKLTLPLPFGFGPPPSVRAEMQTRINGWEAIQQQLRQGEIRNDFKDRVKAIREMRDAKRDTTAAKKKN